MSIDKKLDALREALRATGGLAIAFSGGVDSTFLAAVAQQELGERALAVTALSPMYPEREQTDAARIAEQIGIRYESVISNELDIPGFADNPPDRCYHCKHELFNLIAEIARRHGIERIADGTNADDAHDYRPGRRAAQESGALSPLSDVGLGKEEIRKLSRRMSLPTADKPALACLASRFPYGSRITENGLKAVDRIETLLRDRGLRQVRVRHHGDIARIEVLPDEAVRLLAEPLRGEIILTAKAAGFTYVSVDLQGYRTGSMNEVLGQGGQSPLVP